MPLPADPTLPPGTRLAHYEIKDVLGSGAMGTVYRAQDTSLDRWVAVKVLREGLAVDPDVVDRFVREARAAARANHPNLTHIYFVGDEGGHRFFAMEYVPGTTFEEEVAAHGPLTLARFVDVMVQCARGLSAAHGVGVVHRDVKPSNLMLLPDGTVKVTDFGLAKSLEGDVAASGGGLLLGTPTYMSPEQCRGRGVDVRTDVYALGLTAWYLLAGKPPFRGESLGQMLQDQMNTPLPSLRDARTDLAPALDRALARLCEKDPEQRPKTMDEVAEIFAAFRPRPLEPATLAARASASAIDVAAVLLVGGTIALGVLALENWIHLGDFVPSYVYACIWAGAILASQYALEAWLATTVGKWLFNLDIVREDGAAPSRMALFVRFLLRYPLFTACIASIVPGISGWIIGIGFALQFASFTISASTFPAFGGRTLWDKLTKIRVVYRRTNA